MPGPQPSAVLDPTILITAAIAIKANRSSASRLIVEDALAHRADFTNFTSVPILNELGDVLSRARFPFGPEAVVGYVSLIARASSLVESVQGVVMGCRDPRDDKVFECAMNAAAEYIVSHDKDLLEASPRERYAVTKTGIGIRDKPIAIVTANEFLHDVLGYERAADDTTIAHPSTSSG
jgi:putative PIN family toxin of toxin-antitoxin system